MRQSPRRGRHTLPQHRDPNDDPQWSKGQRHVPGAPPDLLLHLVKLEPLMQWSLDKANCLSPEELARGNSLHHQRHRKEFLASRVVLRHVLAHHAAHSDPTLTLLADRDTHAPQPINVANPQLAQPQTLLHYSLSRTPGFVAILLGHRPVGVDVERRQTRTQASELFDILSARDQRDIRHVRYGLQPKAVTDRWVRLEALTKARGMGLALDPSTLYTRDETSPDWSITGIPIPRRPRLHVAAAWATLSLTTS